MPEEPSSEESDIEFLAGVALDSKESDVHAVGFAKEIYAEMLIDSKKVNFQIDCGASINIITAKHAQGHEIKATTKTLRMWNGSQVKPIGSARIILRNPKTRKKYSVEFIVVESDLTPLIGARAAQEMELITVNDENFIMTSPPPRANEPQVKQITAEELIKQYSDVFDRPLGTLPGEVHLEVDSSAKPVITPTRRVPTALKDDLKKELNRYVEQEILAPVEEPTPWVSSLAVATKKSGAQRVCIDPRQLNEALKRETFQIPILDEILPELSKAKVFSSVDLRSGYWHCVLDHESSLLTTFSTPFGRYRWRRLPFGLSVSSEIFQKRVNQALEGLSGVLDIADDILVYGVGNNEQEATADHNRNLEALLQRCRERNIALNRDKLRLKRKEVPFMGHVLTSNGVKIDPEKAKAVQDMPKPEDVEGIQRVNGFVNYLAKFLPHLADVMEPLRRLTRKDAEWQWTEEQDKSFGEVKKLVTAAPILSYYDPKEELVIQCDASQKGLGAALLQKGKPIAYASRALTDTETRYAQIEKEMLAIVFSLEKFHQYTFGRPVIVRSDHKPLESILKKPLSSAPRRLQGMMMRLQKYNIDVHYECGAKMYIADLLSRAYLPEVGSEDDKEFELVNMIKLLPASEQKLAEIQKETEADRTLQVVKSMILTGWPNDKKGLPLQAAPYNSMRDELTFQDGIILRGERLVIPSSLRKQIKSKLHSSHMGTESCLRRAREHVFWPGMSAEIKREVEKCEICRTFEASQQKETLMPHEAPMRPWQKVGTDLFEFKNKSYLVTVDYFSNFWEVDKLPDTKARTVILKLKNHFARYGCPDEVVSDNGPQFSCNEFATFARTWEFKHCTISPGNSKANGKVESAVKTAKRLLRKALEAGTDPYLAILDYRNTPTQGIGSSPAQRLMSRRTKTLLPTTNQLLQPQARKQAEERAKLIERQQKQKWYYDRTAKDLKPLEKGDAVRMKPLRPGEKKWRKALVIEKRDQRSYTVATPDGGTYCRNRVHLRKTQEPPPIIQDNDSPPPNIPVTYNQPVNPEVQAASNPPPKSPDKPSEHKPLEVNKDPPSATVRPTRTRRPPERLKDYVRY